MIQDIINETIARLQAAKCCNCDHTNDELESIKESISKIHDDILILNFISQNIDNVSLRVAHIEETMFEQHSRRSIGAKALLSRLFSKSTLTLLWLCSLTSIFAASLVFLIQRIF